MESQEGPPPPQRAIPEPFDPYIGVGRRVLAYAIDTAIVLIPISLLMNISPIGEQLRELREHDPESHVHAKWFFAALVSLCGSWIFSLMESGHRQATLGKRLLRAKVVDLNGEAMTFGAAYCRNIQKFLGGLLAGLGLLVACCDPDRQGWHDRSCNTYVVRSDLTPEHFRRLRDE